MRTYRCDRRHSVRFVFAITLKVIDVDENARACGPVERPTPKRRSFLGSRSLEPRQRLGSAGTTADPRRGERLKCRGIRPIVDRSCRPTGYNCVERFYAKQTTSAKFEIPVAFEMQPKSITSTEGSTIRGRTSVRHARFVTLASPRQKDLLADENFELSNAGLLTGIRGLCSADQESAQSPGGDMALGTGPIRKRDEERVRRNKDDVETETVEVIGTVDIPQLNIDDAHPLVQDIYESLKESAQSRYYEPSDWSMARLAMYAINDCLKGKGEDKRISPMMLTAVNQMLSNLLVTEGDRRRVRLEIERKPNLASVADITTADKYRVALGVQ